MRQLLAITALCLLLAVVHGQDEDDFYAILGLEKEREDATDQDIKRQFRKLSKKFHPDHNPSGREAYTKIQRAHEVLGDRKRRKIFDMKGHEGLKQLEESEKNPHQRQMDPFAAMFGMGGGGNNNKGQNMQLKMSVPLSDVYNGHMHKITINKQKLCKQCKGSGAASKADFAKCPHCKGKGVVLQRIQLAPGFVQQAEAPCNHCGGTGRKIKKPCPACRGERVTRGDQVLEVDIERGIPDEHQIVFEMEADQSPDVLPGDVIVIVNTKPDSTFRRKGNDLETTLKISLRDALLGFKKSIVHMDGHAVDVELPGIVQFGKRIKIAGEGMPIHNVPSEKGDLFVILEFEMPRSLTDAQIESLKSVL